MSNYKSDPNNPRKQIPGPQPPNAFDRFANPDTGSFHKSPHYILVNTTLTNTAGFFFGDSASFSSKITAEDAAQAAAGTSALTGSQHYSPLLNAATAGTTLEISPTAWSGSTADIGKITFVYKGGLDGMGRR